MASAKSIKIRGTEYILIKGEKRSIRVTPKEADEIVGILKSAGFEVEQMEFNVKKAKL